MTEVKPSAAVEMTLLTKERPLVSEMKAWIEENLTRLPPDQRALVMGVEPQGVYAVRRFGIDEYHSMPGGVVFLGNSRRQSAACRGGPGRGPRRCG